MRHRDPQDLRCTYLLVIEQRPLKDGDLRSLGAYLSDLSATGCDVVIVDGSPMTLFEHHSRTLRWVGRHVASLPKYRAPSGFIDPVRAALDLAACEKVIIADTNVRYSSAALTSLCQLLERHEVVEPQDYFDPLPWWTSIEAGRMLLHRGVEPLPDHGATFGVHRRALSGLRSIDSMLAPCEDHVRRLASVGAEVHSAAGVFVRRLPPPLGEWVRGRSRQADDDFSLPVKTAFFLALLPMALMLAAFGGLPMAGGYGGAVVAGSLALALRGRAGAASFFPLRACLAAPLWVLERSVSVYWALFRKLRGVAEVPRGAPVDDRARVRVASGE